MARIRSIKPELRTSEKVASWPFEVRYFWILLWGYVNDHGKGVDNAKLIKADAYPLDDDVSPETIESWLQVLAASEVIHRYEVAGKRYLKVLNWREHQKPQHPARDAYPDPHEDSKDSPETLMSPSRGPHEEKTDDSDPNLQNPKSDGTHEDLMKSSGDPHDTLTHEQGAGSREQGAGSREQGVGAGSGPRRIPDDFHLTDDMKNWAKEFAPAINVEASTKEFIDYWASDGGRRKDWTKTWKNDLKKKQGWAVDRGWKPSTSSIDLTDPKNW